jgi:hypothetical protein
VKRIPPSPPTPQPRNRPSLYPSGSALYPVLFAILFFLCDADLSFASRIHEYNIRWGQILLFIFVLVALGFLLKERKDRSTTWLFHLQILKFWFPFFLLYLLAALFAENRSATLLKWGWGIFNIGGAAILALSPLGKGFIEKGFKWATILLSLFILFQAVALYGLGASSLADHSRVSHPLFLTLFQVQIPLGYAQYAWPFEGQDIFRPSAFFYEPSYAGCSLAFAFPLVMAMNSRLQGWRRFLLPALVLGTVVLISSRAGILSCALTLLVSALFGLRRFFQDRLYFLLKTTGLSILILGLFLLLPLGSSYLRFIAGPLIASSVQRLQAKHGSENERVSSAIHNVQSASENPLLGKGVVLKKSPNDQGLAQVAMNTWVELKLESGWLGLLSFIFAILATLRAALRRGVDGPWVDFLIAAWISHFLVHLNFTQTFPRLDYWLMFFLSIRLLLDLGQPSKKLKSIR